MGQSPIYHSKRHPDPISHFATVNETDRLTDSWDWRQVCIKSHFYLIVSNTANNTYYNLEITCEFTKTLQIL